MDLKTLDEIPPWDWPANSDKLILKILDDKNAPAPDRILAAQLAGNGVTINDKIAASLLVILADNGEPEELRCKAAISLGPALEYGDIMEFDDPEDIMLSEKSYHEVRERLSIIYQDTGTPKEVRRRILEGAVRAPMDWHKKAIQEAYANKDEKWNLTAVFAMGYVKGFEKQILESLENENPDIFYEAVCAAGRQEIKAAWPYIDKLLNQEDIDKYLLIAAIDAAATINPVETVERLSDLSYSDDDDISEAAEEALFMANSAINPDLLEDDLY